MGGEERCAQVLMCDPEGMRVLGMRGVDERIILK
jgi:hypothetical protein